MTLTLDEDDSSDINAAIALSRERIGVMSANYPGDEIAKQAFDVMMRRGWWAFCDSEKWFVDGEGTRILYHKKVGNLVEPMDQPPWSDPFTALVEADRWYRENVEGKP